MATIFRNRSMDTLYSVLKEEYAKDEAFSSLLSLIGIDDTVASDNMRVWALLNAKNEDNGGYQEWRKHLLRQKGALLQPEYSDYVVTYFK